MSAHIKGTKSAVLLDADWTVWEGDVFEAFLLWMTENVNKHARENFDGYFSRLRADKLEEAFRFGAATLQGFSPKMVARFMRTALDEAGTEITTTRVFDRTVKRGIVPRANIVSLIEQFQQVGVKILIVSASPQILVETTLEYFNIKAQAIGLRNIVKDGVFTDELEEPVSIGMGKVACFEKVISPDVKLILGVGDSPGDVPMMMRCERQGVPSADCRLANRARKEGWFIFGQHE